ncbi:hypothetical protein [Haloferax larsenii]|uniref:Methyltransferase domain-containing protein n=1 Tax=Haloferax larsenii TaxID=302484 RepID=A0A1H7T3F9_HALLR|nr:hypothetical protein [Haloferax larsenii]SEL78337.1 hypothetical protein SAMN04488691_10821 [Haloferax larsenii]
MTKDNKWGLYEELSHVEQRRPLWETLADEFAPERVLYPGSYVDISPSFVFPDVTYVDMDQRCPTFFTDDAVQQRVPYSYQFIHGDYREPLDIAPVDLLLSQYAGPISHYCKQYVRPGGHLLANNSHADAGVAALDPDWELVGVVRGSQISRDVEGYFEPKPGRVADREEMIESMMPIGYTKTASNYLFRLKSTDNAHDE